MKKATVFGVILTLALLGALYAGISSKVPTSQDSPAFAIALESAITGLEKSRGHEAAQQLTFDPGTPTCEPAMPTCEPGTPTCVTLVPVEPTCYIEDPNCCTYELTRFTCDPQEPTCEWGAPHCLTGRYSHPTCSASPTECPEYTYEQQYTCLVPDHTCEPQDPRCERLPTAVERTTWGAIKSQFE
jgi:hypothetical protein